MHVLLSLLTADAEATGANTKLDFNVTTTKSAMVYNLLLHKGMSFLTEMQTTVKHLPQSFSASCIDVYKFPTATPNYTKLLCSLFAGLCV
jgi:hypothetical protein